MNSENCLKGVDPDQLLAFIWRPFKHEIRCERFDATYFRARLFLSILDHSIIAMIASMSGVTDHA